MNLVILSIIIFPKNFEKRYNSQSIGLGKAFAQLGHKVNVISLEQRKDDYIEDRTTNLRVSHLACKSIGGNTYGYIHKLPKEADAIICFADNKVSFCRLDKFCKRNNIPLFPYVGILKSTSPKFIVRLLMSPWGRINVRLFKRLPTFAKTTYVRDTLVKKGVKDVTVTPVGLDLDKLETNVKDIDRRALRSSFEYNDNDKVLLFVGRLVEEKRPFAALSTFESLYKKDNSYKLIIIGKGPLQDDIKNWVSSKDLAGSIKIIPSVQNTEMWKYYIACDCSLNFNLHEIFGMSILEAMYYGCPVVAHSAPGPNMIISDNIDSYLFDDDSLAPEIVEKALERGRLKDSHEKILNSFTWQNTATIMDNIIRKHLKDRNND